MLSLRPSQECRWDCVSLGEVMLRLDPGWGRVRTARSFRVYEGGGEYNVARALRKVFGLRTAVVTSLVDNEVGHLAEDLMMAGGVDLRHVKWLDHDGVGASARVGLNFTEKGFGIRPALGVSDRAGSAASQLAPGDVDWQRLFEQEGCRWFHTGGIFAALSASTAAVALEAISAARRAGTVVSYDLNYRPSLWTRRGGQPAAIDLNRRLARNVDVMLGNEADFTHGLGFEVPGVDHEFSELDSSKFKAMIGHLVEAFPNFKMVATTLRNAKTAGVNDWGAILYAEGSFYDARTRHGLEIYDRVGGGDGFASGMIWSLLQGGDPSEAVEFGAAHGALTMTTPGDTSMASISDVQRAVSARSARVVR